MKKPSIGALRYRLLLEEPLRTPDGGGGVSISWSPAATVWGAVHAKTGIEKLSAGRNSSKISHEITIRYRDGVLPSMRFRQDGRVFEILAVLTLDQEKRWLRCLCEERNL